MGYRFGGRQKGTPNKRTQEVIDLAAKLGVSPMEVLLRITGNDWQGLGYEAPTFVKLTKEGPVEVERITLQDRLSAAKATADFIYPKLKAIEHSGSVESEAVLTPVTREAIIEAIKNDPFNTIDIEGE